MRIRSRNVLRSLNRKDVFVAVAILAVAAGYFAWSRLAPRPEDDIRRSLKRAAEAFERADANALLAELSPEYRGELADRAELRGLARRYFDEYGPTEVAFSTIRINVRGGIALAEVTARSRARNAEKWGAEAASSWRIAYAEYESGWHVEDVVPLAFMGHEVGGFDFRQELRRLAEDALDEATRSLEAEAVRQARAESERLRALRRREEALAQRYPAEGEAWVLDDFEDETNLWVSQPWAHPAELGIEEFEGSKRLKIVVGQSEEDKAALRRRLLPDLGSRASLTVDLFNANEFDVRVALAFEAQGPRGRRVWYESPPKPVSAGAGERLAFDLLAEDYKTERSEWRHEERIPDLSRVSDINLVIYTAQGGTFYLDGLVAYGGADGIEEGED